MSQPLWTGDELAEALGISVRSDVRVSGVSIDTRTLKAGDLFVAIRGEKVDGHDFAAKAAEAGAAAILADHPLTDVAIPQLAVADTFEGLRELARFAVARCRARRIAVTGSVGKTGTKEMLALVLGDQASVHATQGNLNNHYGLPLTLARMSRETVYAVLEMGMNHAGELTPLSRLARPDVAVITTVEPAHIEFFPKLSDVAQAKSEIFEGLEPDGVAVLNRDNPYFPLMAKMARDKGARIITFGAHIEAEFRLLHCAVVGANTEVLALAGERPLAYRIGAAGRHWGLNSLSVLAAVEAVGADVRAAAEKLSMMAPPKGRGARTSVELSDGGSFELIDESYNASPASMKAAIATLGQMRIEDNGRRIAVLGDMLELGSEGPRLHRELRAALEKAGVDRVFTAGPLMEGLFEELPQDMKGGHAATSADLAPLVASFVRACDLVMVKGSAGSRMGRVVEALAAPKMAQMPAVNGH
jgi:UDP-N-acetylmuramoyl-tripeptide--D-alanyl-D-alanine ligase